MFLRHGFHIFITSKYKLLSIQIDVTTGNYREFLIISLSSTANRLVPEDPMVLNTMMQVLERLKEYNDCYAVCNRLIKMKVKVFLAIFWGLNLMTMRRTDFIVWFLNTKHK